MIIMFVIAKRNIRKTERFKLISSTTLFCEGDIPRTNMTQLLTYVDNSRASVV